MLMNVDLVNKMLTYLQGRTFNSYDQHLNIFMALYSLLNSPFIC